MNEKQTYAIFGFLVIHTFNHLLSQALPTSSLLPSGRDKHTYWQLQDDLVGETLKV